MYGDAFIMQASTHGGNDTLNGGPRLPSADYQTGWTGTGASHVETTYELCDFSRRLVLAHDLRAAILCVVLAVSHEHGKKLSRVVQGERKRV